jgi:hypothetical protein
MFLLATVAMVVMLTSTCDASILCYACSGYSGQTSTAITSNDCGLPFKDNASYPLPVAYCDGVCFTQTHYDGSIGTTIIRSCSDAPISDGCERRVDGTTSYISWTCIKTCTADKCNTGSDATSLVSIHLSLLLLLALVSRCIFLQH